VKKAEKIYVVENFLFLGFGSALLKEKTFYWWTKLNIVTRI